MPPETPVLVPPIPIILLQGQTDFLVLDSWFNISGTQGVLDFKVSTWRAPEYSRQLANREAANHLVSITCGHVNMFLDICA